MSGKEMQLKRIDEIDGMRAIAMTMVVAEHCGLLPFGWMGVWLFFLISGYVITRNFIHDTKGRGSAFSEYAQFMRRRFFRIVPAYVFFIALFSVVFVIYGFSENLKQVPFLLSFTYNWRMIFDWWHFDTVMPGMRHLWTISVEEQFYIFYPLLFLFLPKTWYKRSLFALICLGPFVRWGFFSWLATQNSDPKWISFGVYVASFTQFDAFLIGALIANYEKFLIENPRFVKILALCVTCIAGLYAVSYVMINRASGAVGMAQFYNIFSGGVYGQGREHFIYPIVDLVAAVVLIYGVVQAPITRVLRHRFFSYIGRISYGGYLYQGLVLWFCIYYFGRPTEMSIPYRILVFAFVWPVTIMLAGLSYRYLEQPILAWSRKRHSQASP